MMLEPATLKTFPQKIRKGFPTSFEYSVLMKDERGFLQRHIAIGQGLMALN